MSSIVVIDEAAHAVARRALLRELDTRFGQTELLLLQSHLWLFAGGLNVQRNATPKLWNELIRRYSRSLGIALTPANYGRVPGIDPLGRPIYINRYSFGSQHVLASRLVSLRADMEQMARLGFGWFHAPLAFVAFLRGEAGVRPTKLVKG